MTTSKLSELTGDYVLDTARTRIGFVGRHAMATRVRGRFDEFEGGAHLDGDNPSKSSAELTIQAKSIQTRHLWRDEHLRGKFLDVDSHPTITFASTSVEQVGETSFKVTGDLTIRGVTKPVTVDFALTGDQNDPSRVGLKGSVTINRMDWAVNWNAATGILLSEKVTLEFDATALRQS
ncbi:polyisoprenoid-binding protein [Acrocarpospora corrugata]|uniref:Polyisoprenoid-binding protein n=1 Tax=Acrocarpospora corrugata TaxID=35763 RepID=A0A5M3W0T3_9ACTN|nr:YceI family protein [Acrocarpospora corrugata]GES00913.1 polyisoprenoid-binding protein [Acrocarpospora corrugata]